MEILSGLPCGTSIEAMVGHFEEELKDWLKRWTEQLRENLGRMGEMERDAAELLRPLAGVLVVSVLREFSVQVALKKRGEEIRKEAEQRKVYCRCRNVLLGCGVKVKVRTYYCGPKRTKARGRRRGAGRRGSEGAGLYPEWAALGIREGVAPGMQSEVARLSVLLPSFAMAREEMARRGIPLDVKVIRRIAREAGNAALGARRADLLRWRAGQFPAGNTLAGKRVVVAVDGGRGRTRVPRRKGRRSKKGRRGFKADWREPKLLIIYVQGEDGRMDATEPVCIDGTLQGPDHLMELLAFHLHRLGADKATRGVFVGDGVDWIWHRVPTVMARLGLDARRWSKCLDLYHVMDHLGKAAHAHPDWDTKQRKRQLTKWKQLLLRGRANEVRETLRELLPFDAKTVQAQIDYLEARWDLLKYAGLRRHKMPVGSGAIESAIRRVINQRLKSPGTFWLEETLEEMLYLRAQVLAGNWEATMERIAEHARCTRQRTWTWEADTLSIRDQKIPQVEDSQHSAEDAA